MTLLDHLSEEERHGFADGSLSLEVQAVVAAHIAICETCRADVASLEQLVRRARSESSTSTGGDALDDMWRGVRAGIEERKIVQLAATDMGASSLRAEGRRRRWVIGAAAAIVLLVAGTMIARRPGILTGGDTTVSPGPSLSTVAESTQVYENEVQTLLNELELRRAMLRPETAASIDQSLRVIDQAIAELRDALAHDPNNPALRQLLASSYRQKVDLLKRVGNAG